MNKYKVVTLKERSPHKFGYVDRLWAEARTLGAARDLLLCVAAHLVEKEGYQIEWLDEDSADVLGYGRLFILQTESEVERQAGLFDDIYRWIDTPADVEEILGRCGLAKTMQRWFPGVFVLVGSKNQLLEVWGCPQLTPTPTTWCTRLPLLQRE